MKCPITTPTKSLFHNKLFSQVLYMIILDLEVIVHDVFKPGNGFTLIKKIQLYLFVSLVTYQG